MDADVIIVGAGLSGLVAANTLEDAGHSVIVLDKGHRVGGRLATQNIQNGIADYGAQFFTARTNIFQEQVDKWLEKDLIKIWGYDWSDGSLKRSVNDGFPRYIATGGMNQLANNLASNVKDIRVHVTVNNIEWQDDLWHVMDDKDNTLTSRVLIMTPPVPQSLELLEGISLTDTDRNALERILFRPCLSGLFVIDGKIDLPEPGALQDLSQVMYWIADNQAKGISPDECIITIHLEPRYSRQRFDDADEDILAFMREGLQKYLDEDTAIKEEQIKRWQYSLPLTTYPHDMLLAEGLPLVFAGDAFGGRGRIEGAYLSGLTAGKIEVDNITPQINN